MTNSLITGLWEFRCKLSIFNDIKRFELLYGSPPFKHKDMRKIFEQIANDEPYFSPYKKISPECKDLIKAVNHLYLNLNSF